ncbi:hypothetical protein KUTeg_010335 [Tegillarca granosa]|uniref:Serine/threonine-protein phosphatase PGAM5, mitochondrial n=1 Tax=Tegillarca granosa TaxID=220873 RepID=A0ABQ9F9C8_TEGGR|nr:hypothetical protein KUTeg_010335 [Tegillarca granosa]
MLNPKKVSKDDKDYESKVEEKTPTATRHLILIRHGQYNTDGERDKDRILTELGRKQAEYVGQRLKDLNFPYTDFISSTMSRAVETAGIIHKFVPNLEWKQCEMLCEGAPIPPEPPHGTWRPEKQQFFQDGARIEAAFKKYFHRADPKQKTDSYEIFVCHANVIRYFVCSLTWITIRPNGRVSLRMLGDSGFMPVDRLSLL